MTAEERQRKPSKYVKVSIRLGAHQVEALRKMFPDVPYNRIIRACVEKQINEYERKVAEKLAQQKVAPLEIE